MATAKADFRTVSFGFTDFMRWVVVPRIPRLILEHDQMNSRIARTKHLVPLMKGTVSCGWLCDSLASVVTTAGWRLVERLPGW